jgi:hypothetical protein
MKHVAVSIKDVVNTNHLSLEVTRTHNGKPEAKKVQMEIYTGWINCNWTAGEKTDDAEVISFLPIGGNHVQGYGSLGILQSAVTVAPSWMAFVEDEATAAAVKDAHVELRPQGLGPTAPSCLVLVANLEAINTTIFTLAYHVTVITPLPPLDQAGHVLDAGFSELALNPGDAPS